MMAWYSIKLGWNSSCLAVLILALLTLLQTSCVQVFPQASKQRVKSDVRATAYTHTESDHRKYGRRNALGTQLMYGEITSAAADWSRYPVGTKFRVKQTGKVYIIDDYGSALVGTDTIDLYVPTKLAMRRWGARYVDIEILEWGDLQRSREILKPRSRHRHVRAMLEGMPATL